jgi:hypothetical protein
MLKLCFISCLALECKQPENLLGGKEILESVYFFKYGFLNANKYSSFF